MLYKIIKYSGTLYIAKNPVSRMILFTPLTGKYVEKYHDITKTRYSEKILLADPLPLRYIEIPLFTQWKFHSRDCLVTEASVS